jgi:hypothetical protein
MIARCPLLLLLAGIAVTAPGCAGVDLVSLSHGDYTALLSENQSAELDWGDACATNTAAGYEAFLREHPGSDHAGTARYRIRRIESVSRNWGRLKRGMSVYEVDDLVGPLKGFGIDAIRGAKDAADADRPPTVGGEVVYSDDYCELTFDVRGDLLLWARK